MARKKPTPEEEHSATAKLREWISQVESLEAHQGGTHIDLAVPGSELQIDDSMMGYMQTSHLIDGCLSISIDAMTTARLVLQSPTNDGPLRVPMRGLYPLARSSLEAASLALWLVQPEDRRTRLTRSLQARWEDVNRDDQLVQTFSATTDGDGRDQISYNQKVRRENSRDVRAKKAAIRRLAKAAGIDESEFNRGLPGFGAIVGEAAEGTPVRPHLARGVWHFVSGLTHPSSSRTLSASVVELEEDDQSAPVVRARFTADLTLVHTALFAAATTHNAALATISARGGNPSITWNRQPD